jgi:hypothetical protein
MALIGAEVKPLMHYQHRHASVHQHLRAEFARLRAKLVQ